MATMICVACVCVWQYSGKTVGGILQQNGAESTRFDTVFDLLIICYSKCLVFFYVCLKLCCQSMWDVMV